MDFMSTTQLLGNLGEFLGAIAVFITLIYLAIQVRHGREAVAANTKSLEENRRLALAQVYQGRSNQVQQICMLRAQSDRWPELIVKAQDDGFQALSRTEQARWSQFLAAESAQLDNVHYQYQLGLLDDDFYEHTFKPVVKGAAPLWVDADALFGRRAAFVTEVEQLLQEELRPS
jgi:hypothetical protein